MFLMSLLEQVIQLMDLPDPTIGAKLREEILHRGWDEKNLSLDQLRELTEDLLHEEVEQILTEVQAESKPFRQRL